MPEIVTVGLGAIAAYLGKDGLQKLLGPTAEYLGSGLRDLTQKRVEAIGKIFSRASEKLGDRLDDNAAVPPKVLKHIVDNGSFATDEIEIEYLAGILASSRSQTERDNRGASFTRLIDSLSNYQIRAHYILYEAVRRAFSGKGIYPNLDGRPKLESFVDYTSFSNAMAFNEEERADPDGLLGHILFGLHNASLIENFYFGAKDHMAQKYPGAFESGLIFQPSALGIELYLWVFGEGNRSVGHFLSANFLPQAPDPPIPAVTAFPLRLESQ